MKANFPLDLILRTYNIFKTNKNHFESAIIID